MLNFPQKINKDKGTILFKQKRPFLCSKIWLDELVFLYFYMSCHVLQF